MSNSTFLIYGRFCILGILLGTGASLSSCGGAVADDGSLSTGSVTSTAGGASGSGSGGFGAVGAVSASGGGSHTGPAPYCFGVVENPADGFCVGLSEKVGTFDAASAECVFTIPIAAGLHLNPALLRLYFDVDSSGRLVIPYIGDRSSCPTTGSSGGWYATNTTSDGSSSIGLCGCTCAAAKKYPVSLEVACEGVRF